MVIKPRKTPVYHLQYEALIRRLPKNHSQYQNVTLDWKKFQSGYAGEEEIDYYLDLFRAAPYSILNQVHLLINGSSFEIDTLLVFRNMLVILEVKNYKGKLEFDSSISQVTQHANGVTKSLPWPFFQTQRQEILLRDWLTKKGYKNIPICKHIVLANSSAVITSNTPMSGISKLTGIYSSLMALYESHPKQVLSAVEVDHLSNKLLQSSSEKRANLLQKYNIGYSELLFGVLCPKCASNNVRRKRANWQCTTCNHKDPIMHQQALWDYSLLVGNIITRKQAHFWLNIKSESTCSRLLKTVATPTSKRGKLSSYYLTLP